MSVNDEQLKNRVIEALKQYTGESTDPEDLDMLATLIITSRDREECKKDLSLWVQDDQLEEAVDILYNAAHQTSDTTTTSSFIANGSSNVDNVQNQPEQPSISHPDTAGNAKSSIGSLESQNQAVESVAPSLKRKQVDVEEAAEEERPSKRVDHQQDLAETSTDAQSNDNSATAAVQPAGSNDRTSDMPRRQCRRYHVNGFCSYGDKCDFEHGADRLVYVNGNDGWLYFRGQGEGARRSQGAGRNTRMGGGAVPAKNSNSITITNIPQQFCKTTDVSNAFEKFGSITSIQVEPEKQQASIEFSTAAQMTAAVESTEVFFNDRFVKVMRQNAGLVPGGDRKVRAPSPDPELVKARKEELAKKNEERQKLKSLEHQVRQERIDEMNQNIEGLKKLMDRLEQKGLSDQDRTETMTKLRELQAEIDKQRVSLGTMKSAPPSDSPTLRGGYQGRGRGGWRGRSMNLDNRSKNTEGQ